MLKVFGQTPSGPRRARIEQSPNYRNGIFHNLSPTEVMEPGASTLRIMGKWLNKPRNTEPAAPLPFLRTDLYTLPEGAPAVVWFGHSSYLLKINGKIILIDPVFSGNASPFSFNVKAFPGSNEYGVEDFPDPDVLVLTHDHYDHLDYRTLLLLKNRVRQIICPLGVGEHLEYWASTRAASPSSTGGTSTSSASCASRPRLRGIFPAAVSCASKHYGRRLRSTPARTASTWAATLATTAISRKSARVSGLSIWRCWKSGSTTQIGPSSIPRPKRPCRLPSICRRGCCCRCTGPNSRWPSTPGTSRSDAC
jgi:hypothetical protein